MQRLLILALTIVLSSAAEAETISIPLGQQGSGEMAVPQRGDTKIRVLERFGLADEEHPAVGQPPITRWDYRTFSVYFEDKQVIDSVQHHQRVAPSEGGLQP